MPTILLLNSELLVEVDDQDYITLILLGPYRLTNSGYAQRTGSGHEYLHILVATRMGLIITDEVDHIDRSKMNCKRENLRLATRQQNMVNRNVHADSLTKEKNIDYIKSRNQYRVRIYRYDKVRFYQLFRTLEAAVEARDSFLKRFPT